VTKAIIQIVLVVLVIGAGVLGGTQLMLLKEEPAKEQRTSLGPLVEVVAVERTDVPLTISGHGTVAAKTMAQIVPQVAGRVVETHPNLATGGFVKADDPLLRIDDSDYTLAASRAEAELEATLTAIATAEAQITEAKTRLTDALDDLERTKTLRDRGVATDREVTKAKVTVDVIESQLNTAQSALNNARAQRSLAKVAVEQAKLNLERTVVSLPFDAIVVSERVDVGQFITAGQSVGEVYGTAAVEIAVPLEDHHLRWFETVPIASQAGGAAEAKLPKATVHAEFFGRRCEWPGRVVRTEANVDARSRMVHVVVEVRDPFRNVEHNQTPLMPGVFTERDITGRTLTGVLPLPRYAVRDKQTVWTVDADNKLHIRAVEIARRDRERVYISGGIEAGDRVVISGLDVVVEGMTVRVAGDAETAVAETDADSDD